MANWLIALLIAISASVWVYAKFMRSTGNNSKNAGVAAGITGLLVFVLILIITNLLSS
jgi:hypothetical protein